MLWEVAHGSVHSLWNQSLCLGLRRGLAPLCWQERAWWELLCSWRAQQRSWVGFLPEICSAVPCLARNLGLSFPVFLLLAWVQCLEQGAAEEPPARWLWQSAWAPTLLAPCAPGAQPGPSCSSEGAGAVGSAGGSAAPLTLFPCPGLLQAPAPHPALLWHQGELQVLPLSGGAGSPGSLKHRDQSSVGPVPLSSPLDPPVPQAGALVRHSSFLSSVRTKARTIKAGGKSLPLLGKKQFLGPAWECGAPGRAQEAAGDRAPPEVCPPARCHIYLSRTRGCALAGCSPGSPQPLSGTRQCWPGGLCPPSWAQGQVCPTVQPWLWWHGPGCGSDWDRTAAWWLLTAQTQRFPLRFLFLLLLPRIFTQEQQRVKKVVAVVCVSFSPLLFTLFAQDTQ